MQARTQNHQHARRLSEKVTVEINGDSDNRSTNSFKSFELEPAKSKPNTSAYQECKKLLKNTTYVFCVLNLSVLFFVISGIQYWVSDYMTEVVGLSEAKTHIYFSLTCITSPIIGAVLSGTVASKFEDGYNSKYALPVCIIACLICVTVGIPVPMVDDPLVLTGLIWI